MIGFSPTDRLYEAAERAHDAVFALRVMPHSDECERCEREPASEPAADWVI